MLSEKENPAGSEQGVMKGAVMENQKITLSKITLRVKVFLARWSWLVGTWS